MTIVTEYDWQSDTFTHHTDPGARQAWRAVVAEIAERAKATLPEANGRVDKAVALVLAGDVELLEGGKAKVASQSNGTTQYVVCNGTCECKDFPKAPSGWCKHRIAAGILKRAHAKAATTNGPSASAPAPAQPDAPTAPLPEAPASVNVHLELAGRQVQLTLRDTDEGRLLQRLDAVLQRFPLVVKSTDTAARPEGWCATHGVQMKLNHGKEGRTWYSHKTAEGWCKGR
jgi:hypothetical protein